MFVFTVGTAGLCSLLGLLVCLCNICNGVNFFWHCWFVFTAGLRSVLSCINHSLNGSSDSVNGDLQFLWE